MKVDSMQCDGVLDDGRSKLLTALVCLISNVYSLEEALFHLSHSNLHTVWGQDSLICQVLNLRLTGHSGESICLAVGSSCSEDHLEIEL